MILFCLTGGTRGTEMEDILIVSCKQSQAAQLWVSYLNNCFEQISKMRNRPPFRYIIFLLNNVAVRHLTNYLLLWGITLSYTYSLIEGDTT